MKAANITGLIVPNSDPHLSEYVCNAYKNLSFITGFTGSAGTALITLDEAFLYTDGRYFLQAEEQLPEGIQLMKMGLLGTTPLMDLIAEKIKSGSTIAIDGKLTSYNYYKQLQENLPGRDIILDKDLFDSVWIDRPSVPKGKAFIHPVSFNTRSASEKIAELIKYLNNNDTDYYISSSLDDICYALNIRGTDVEYTPVVYSYLIISKIEATLFIDDSKLNKELLDYFDTNKITVKSYDSFYDTLASLKDKKVFIDENKSNTLIITTLAKNNELIFGNDLIYYKKTLYSDFEIENTKKTHIRDGAHMVSFIKWLYEHLDNVTEYDCYKKISELRSRDEYYISDSFAPIAGYGKNAAIVHYNTDKNVINKMEREGLFLLDSGGQYMDGTTDITRTFALGHLKEEEKEAYTLVLKGHIDLAMAVFPEGTKGETLDFVARQPLYKYGLNYNHGTGHSVGYVLGVHEGYARIGKNIKTEIKANMVLSNEPGFYKDFNYGIRIESLVAVKEVIDDEYGKFLGFDTLTMCPIDTAPIVKSMLSDEEIDWLNGYHKEVRHKLMDIVDESEKELLIKLTEDI